LFDTGYILKLFLTIMLVSLLPFADLWGVLYIDEYVPRYLLLAGIAGTALVGLIITFVLIRRLLAVMRGRIRDGYYPGTDFFHLVGLLISGILLLTPGVIGDALGLILLVPTFRAAVARLLFRRLEDRFKELYEYLKLYEM
jgi:UPF0716 protein FxsA